MADTSEQKPTAFGIKSSLGVRGQVVGDKNRSKSFTVQNPCNDLKNITFDSSNWENRPDLKKILSLKLNNQYSKNYLQVMFINF